MQDTQLIGNGASRLLKGPPNAVSLYPDFASWIADYADKGVFCDLSNLQAQGVKVFGTGYSKAEVLPDSLCSALGLPTTATPAQALDKLRSLITAATPKYATGSYEGSNETKKTLTLPFTPKIVFVVSADSHKNQTNGDHIVTDTVVTLIHGCASAGSDTLSGNYLYPEPLTVTWSGNSVTWSPARTGNGAEKARNLAGVTYLYFAIG